MNIYWYLMRNDPQALQNLSDYQKKHYKQKLTVPPKPPPPKIPIETDLEAIGREMRKPPSRSRRE